MKKLMIAAAIVCAAALSHGAALNWKVTAIPGSPEVATPAAGWMGYRMDAATYETFAGLAADRVAAYVTANALDSKDMTVRNGAGTLNHTFGSWTYDENNPQTVSGYIVLFDNATPASATYYANTAVIDSRVPQSGDMMPGGAFVSVTSGWKSTAAAPEPTSGLLLLLGVAGMALKRKRFAQSKSEVEVEQWNGKIPL